MVIVRVPWGWSVTTGYYWYSIWLPRLPRNAVKNAHFKDFNSFFEQKSFIRTSSGSFTGWKNNAICSCYSQTEQITRRWNWGECPSSLPVTIKHGACLHIEGCKSSSSYNLDEGILTPTENGKILYLNSDKYDFLASFLGEDYAQMFHPLEERNSSSRTLNG